MISAFDWLNNPLFNEVALWKVLVVGLPAALAVHFIFSLRKSQKHGYLSPILWVVLTVVVLLLWNATSGSGDGGKGTGTDSGTETETETENPDDPNGTEGTPEEGSEANGGEGKGGSSDTSAKPVSLEIRYNKATKTYTFKNITSGNITETSDLKSELKSMEQSGYIFTRIDAYNLTDAQNNGLKDDYKGCKVETHNQVSTHN